MTVIRPGFPEGRCLAELAERCGFRVCQICHELGCSPAHFRKVFVRDAGLPPKRWLVELRVRRARENLEAGGAAGEVALRLGFSCHASLRRAMGRDWPPLFMQAEVPVSSDSGDGGHCQGAASQAAHGLREAEIPRGLSAGGGWLASGHENLTSAPVGAGRHLDFDPGGDAAAGGRGAAAV